VALVRERAHFSKKGYAITSVCLELCGVTSTKIILPYWYSGEANVLQDFEVTEGKKKVHVAGCRCTKGILYKTGKYRLHRGQEVVYDG
jgi:hypothetical protein